MAKQLFYFYKVNEKLHKGQIDIRKYQSAIDAIALFIQKV